jgi:hypothetical protein
MAFDGNGNWISDFSAVADRDANIKILASRFDNIFIADIAQSFENCLTKDMQVKPQQAFDANSYKIINVSNPTNDTDAVNKYTLDSAIDDFGSKTGMIMQFAGDVAPDGWLFCDGSAVSRTTYSNLFSVIGTKYGSGDGTTTFNLPDYTYRQIGTTLNVVGNGNPLKVKIGSVSASTTTIEGRSIGSSGWLQNVNLSNGTVYPSPNEAESSFEVDSSTYPTCDMIIKY